MLFQTHSEYSTIYNQGHEKMLPNSSSLFLPVQSGVANDYGRSLNTLPPQYGTNSFSPVAVAAQSYIARDSHPSPDAARVCNYNERNSTPGNLLCHTLRHTKLQGSAYLGAKPELIGHAHSVHENQQARPDIDTLAKELRLTKNRQERRRVAAINVAFKKLRDLLPDELTPRVSRLSKLGTLKLATEYINILNRHLSAPTEVKSSETALIAGRFDAAEQGICGYRHLDDTRLPFGYSQQEHLLRWQTQPKETASHSLPEILLSHISCIKTEKKGEIREEIENQPILPQPFENTGCFNSSLIGSPAKAGTTEPNIGSSLVAAVSLSLSGISGEDCDCEYSSYSNESNILKPATYESRAPGHVEMPVAHVNMRQGAEVPEKNKEEQLPGCAHLRAMQSTYQQLYDHRFESSLPPESLAARTRITPPDTAFRDNLQRSSFTTLRILEGMPSSPLDSLETVPHREGVFKTENFHDDCAEQQKKKDAFIPFRKLFGTICRLQDKEVSEQDISKKAVMVWQSLTAEEKRPYILEQQHQEMLCKEMNPDKEMTYHIRKKPRLV
ncbi:helix-loop-helix domain-containing protein [Endozoicomonas sp. SCSIO W0465]|uniref:helix-loop-helix domain-containing protein n=1 Tax=Endozoicomonas sp. SCSIO W0465 TaxID=2918516 RepID=UPI0020757224|nr:helix-loop-helix domain-containing protein [Endozoicomonas sp. SCSIO W0465]USE34325.1 helix-loop-helix domain-containing protein [Endozoicomonas sp. SCSIO W0465]